MYIRLHYPHSSTMIIPPPLKNRGNRDDPENHHEQSDKDKRP